VRTEVLTRFRSDSCVGQRKFSLQLGARGLWHVARIGPDAPATPRERLLREGEPTTHVELLIDGFVKVTTVVEDVEALLSLVDIVIMCGHRTDQGWDLGVLLSQSELATMVGIADATVQKALRHLRAQGVIHTGYRSVTIVDLPGLRTLCALPDITPNPR
jgi:CRP-like cAMP-binding protein